jgi:histidine ammonia-lyase
MDDNPLVVVDEDRLVSNGNFEPIALALAFDALRPALAHVGQLSERRMNHLWRRFFDTAQVFSADGMRAADQAPVGPLVRYSAATRYAALRGLASPASLDVPSLDEGQEDHATNAPEVVARTDEALDALEDILAVELAMAESVLRAAGAPQQLGVGTAAAIGALRDLFASLGPAPTSTVLDAVRDALSGPILAAADDAT